MLSMIRLYLCLVPLFAGVYFAWEQGWTHPLSALGLFVAGILAASAVLFGLFETWNSEVWQGFAGAWVILGFVALLVESPFTKPDQQLAQISLYNRFLEISTGNPGGRPLTPEERAFARGGFQACVVQPSLDELEFTRSALKTEHLGPAATLVDEGIKESTGRPERMNCLDYYRQLHATRPDLFIRFDREYPSVAEAN